MSQKSSIHEIFENLWKDYSRINPQADAIHRLLEARGEKVINDHVAFRTYNDPRINLRKMAKVFLENGFVEKDEYLFKEKKLVARFYQHPDPEIPKVFISELKLEEISEGARTLIKKCIDQLPVDFGDRPDFYIAGRPWSVSFQDYTALANESEYAGWMSAFGFRANHFTVSFNHLKTFQTLQELNNFLKKEGFALNASGGEIKGTREECLEQSSTMAAHVDWKFSDGTHKIPACYYEFARRYPQANGELYQGFIAASADKIFESTNRIGG